MSHEVMIVAAEASSAHYAEQLLRHWQNQKKEVTCFGVGTQAMESVGFERLGEAEKMAVVGISEVWDNYGYLREVFDRLVSAATERRPKVVLVLDYPDFNLMLAQKMHALGIKVVYYISPQIWAWRQGRVKKIKKYCDRVLVLFPFEKEFYDRHGVPAEFVGHPLLDDLDPRFLDLQKIDQRRQRYGWTPSDVLLGLMPGSRQSELKMNLVLQLQVAQQLHQQFPSLRFAILLASTIQKDFLQSLIDQSFPGGTLSFPYVIMQDKSLEMISLMDLLLVASGTATLQVGLLQKPMVIMYRLKRLTWWVAQVLARHVRFIGLPNLILNEPVVPELKQAQVPDMVKELRRFLEDESYRRVTQQKLGELAGKLGNSGVTARVAQALEAYLT